MVPKHIFGKNDDGEGSLGLYLSISANSLKRPLASVTFTAFITLLGLILPSEGKSSIYFDIDSDVVRLRNDNDPYVYVKRGMFA
jgi:hypothetical protein